MEIGTSMLARPTFSDRQADRKKDAQDKSLLKNLGVNQRALFRLLSTPNWNEEPDLTEFMVQLSKEKSATRALQMVIGESKDWEGTFSHGVFTSSSPRVSSLWRQTG